MEYIFTIMSIAARNFRMRQMYGDFRTSAHAAFTKYGPQRLKQRIGSVGRFTGRRYKKSRQANAFTVIRNPEGFGLPRALKTQLVWNVKLNETNAGGLSTVVMGGNTVFDCFLGSGTDDAMGHSMLSIVYREYCVSASSIRVEVVNNDLVSLEVMVCPRAEPNLSWSKDEFRVARNSRSAFLTQHEGSRTFTIVKHYASTAAIHGLKDIRDNQSFHSLVAAQPAELWYWYLVFSKDVAEALNAHARVKIVYFVTYSNMHEYGQ